LHIGQLFDVGRAETGVWQGEIFERPTKTRRAPRLAGADLAATGAMLAAPPANRPRRDERGLNGGISKGSAR
jgi:hypothetical protein